MAVAREQTQEKLNALSAATLRHTPSQTYTVGDRLEERAAGGADRAFLFYEDRVFSYTAINAAANRVAHAAHAEGWGTGDVVGLLMENRPEFLVTWFGLAKLGVVTALLNTHMRGRALVHALETTGARRLVVGSECQAALGDLDSARVAALRPWVVPDRLGEGLSLPAGAIDAAPLWAAQRVDDPDPSVRQALVAGDDLFLIFTSGTTGLPKAARLSHMRFLGVGDGMSAMAGYGPDDVIACVLPLYHGAGGMVVISSALSHGAAVALSRRFSASGFWDDVRRYGVTGCQYIGEICRYLLHQPARPDDREHGLRVLMGAGLGPDIWEVFQRRFGVERILEGWSSTEANTSLLNVDNRIGSCGRIPFPELHNGRLLRYDAATDTHPRGDDGYCQLAEPGEVGEFIGAIPDLPDSGAGRFEGYTDSEATARKILEDVFQPGDRWYRSGDLLRCDADGYFTFVDRIGDTYRWKSENVSTQEVAETLAGFPDLRIANVYGVRVPGHEGRAGMASLVLGDRERFDPDAFFGWTESRLPSYASPLFLRLAEAADLTSTFKLRKLDLQRDGYDPSRVADPLFVRDDRARTYRPLSAEALESLGIPPFEAASD